MRTIRTVRELRNTLAGPRRSGSRIGLVPTMGALHAGHLSLMARARRECEVVVASLFVNPSQFNDPGDLHAYPRDEAHDAAMACEVGVDILFAPSVEEVYPAKFSTRVCVDGLTEHLEGSHRGREHFDGVTTVVTKLFNMVGPDVAYFGQKDAQQVMVIKQLVADLDLPVQIAVCPIVRDPDGLALSSRNAHLSPGERVQALALPQALSEAAAAVGDGETDAAAITGRALALLRARGVEAEYFELVSPDTLAPVSEITKPVLALVAARVGNTRLIDNQLLTTAQSDAEGERALAPQGRREALRS